MSGLERLGVKVNAVGGFIRRGFVQRVVNYAPCATSGLFRGHGMSGFYGTFSDRPCLNILRGKPVYRGPRIQYVDRVVGAHVNYDQAGFFLPDQLLQGRSPIEIFLMDKPGRVLSPTNHVQ